MGNGESSDTVLQRLPPLQLCTCAKADELYQVSSRRNLEQILCQFLDVDCARAVATLAVGGAPNLLLNIGSDWHVAQEPVCNTTEWAEAISLWSGKAVNLQPCVWLKVPSVAVLLSVFDDESKRLRGNMKGLAESRSKLEADLKSTLSNISKFVLEREKKDIDEEFSKTQAKLQELKHRRHDFAANPVVHTMFYVALQHRENYPHTIMTHCLCTTDLTKDQLSAIVKAKPKFADGQWYGLGEVRTISQLCVPSSIMADWKRKQWRDKIQTLETDIQHCEEELKDWQAKLVQKRAQLHKIKEQAPDLFDLQK